MEHINKTEWNAYLAGTCTPQRLAWIHEHVKQCPQCRRQMQPIHELEAGLAQWQVNTAGHDIAAKVTHAVLKESHRIHRSGHRRFVLQALRIAALLFFGAALGYRTGNQSAQQYIAKQGGSVIQIEPGYLAAIDLQFAGGLTRSVLSEDASEMEGPQ